MHGIHVLNENDQRPILEDDTIKETGYTIPQNAGDKPLIVNPDDKDACCKQKTIQDANGQKTIFFVKTGSSGQVYDPWSQLGEYSQRRYAQMSGKNTWSYRRVTQLCFDLYLRYLQTQNLSYKLQAERELING